MTYNSTESAYEITKTSTRGVGSILLNNNTFSHSCKVSYDIKLVTSSSVNIQPRITLFNGNNGICGRIIYASSASVYCIAIQQHSKSSDGSSEISYQDCSLNANWYNMEVIYANGTVTMNLKQNDTVIATCTGSETILGDSNELGIVISFNKDSKVYVKNITVL